MSQQPNLAARAGRWSAQHRRKAIIGWLVFVVLAVFVGGAVGTKQLDFERSGVGESGDALRTADDHFPERAEENVLVQARGRESVRDPRFRAAVTDVTRRLERTRYVRNIESPLDSDNAGQISRDGRSALIGFYLPGDDDQVEERVDAPLATVAAAQRAHPGFRVEEFGEASANKALTKRFEDDFRQAEFTSVPLTLIILFVAFGALVAAGVPLLLAISAVAAALGLLGPISQIWPVEQSITSVVLLIGLAVGIDYSLFYLRREREERAAGRSEEAALQAAAATSGRAVLVSGITVMIAMAGMYLGGAATWISFATGTILVVAIAVVGSLTVLPAVLSKLGDRVNKGRLPFFNPERRTGEPRVWGWILDRVLRRPVLWGFLAAALLAVIALPTLHMHTAVSGIDDLPRDLEVMQTYDRIQAAFPGEPLPAVVVVEGLDVTSSATESAVAGMKDRATGRPDLFGQPITEEISPDRRIVEVSIPVHGDGTDDTSNQALETLRTDIVPSTIEQVPDVEAQVAGVTAESKDFNDLMKARVPLVFAFVLGMAFLLLLVTFRSIVIPLKAVLLNLLSVAAAYGAVVWGFQDGNLESVLGFDQTGAIVSWLPFFLFVVLFGLSMDYHVFILTRVREAYDNGMSTEEAVAHGIKTTASVVTAAAVVMVAVFGVFMTLSSIDFKQFGFALAFAVLIDATIVRGVLLPACMKLLGDWNWYLPRWMEWLPRISREPTGRHAPAQPPPAPAD